MFVDDDSDYGPAADLNIHASSNMISFNKQNFFGNLQSPNIQMKDNEFNDAYKKVNELTQSLGREMEAVRVRRPFNNNNNLNRYWKLNVQNLLLRLIKQIKLLKVRLLVRVISIRF